MKKIVFILWFICAVFMVHSQTSWVRVIQAGYLEEDIKTVVGIPDILDEAK